MAEEFVRTLVDMDVISRLRMVCEKYVKPPLTQEMKAVTFV